MEKIQNFKDIIGASTGEKEQMLGKFLYFSLSSLLIEKDKLGELCDGLNIPFSSGKRLSVCDAFRSATGDIADRVIVKQPDGEMRICRVYCRDNERDNSVLRRELVKETLNRRTNQYEKLANIHFDKGDRLFAYDDLSFDPDVDAEIYCQRAEELFDLYQRCANRRHIETICTGFLRSLEATKVSVNGHLYFVPRHTMEKVDTFEAFIEALGKLNLNDTSLTANSFYIIDDAKQRNKMTEEFYLAVKKEIAEYQERCDYLIQSGSSSPAVMERWVVKVQALEEKKRHYEDILRRELDGLDDEFENLRFLSQELSVRARGLRFKQGQGRRAA